MSSYLDGVRSARNGLSPGSVSSVGDTIEQSQVYNSSHPLYKAYTAQLQEKIAEIVARESEKAARAQQAVCTVTLSMEEKNEVTREYPELRIVWPQWRLPVHAGWVARRELVNQYMLHHARTYATSVVHYGGSALASLTFRDVSVKLRTDTTSAVAVHEAFEDDLMAAKLCASAASASSILAWHTDVHQLEMYAAGDVLRKQMASSDVDVRADALIVDGTVSFVSPLQFAAAMVQHRAEIGMFAFPYHPCMLVHKAGELYGTGVNYALTEEHLKLYYPEAVAGETSFNASVWHEWLVNTVRSVAGLPGVSFQFEMMGTRGPFMLVRVVRSDQPVPANVKFVHSLQLSGMEDLTLVRTWRLKNLAVSPYEDQSWEPIELTVPTRVVEKTHDYAMSVPADQFSRHAIRKRLSVVNDRVVVQGTSVVVNEALTSFQLDHLETAIFSHCFVARYEAGQLGAKLRGAVDQIAGFGALTFAERQAHVLVACSSVVHDWTLGAIDQRLRDLFDGIRRWLMGDTSKRRATFEPAPQFIRYETLVRGRSLAVVEGVRSILFDTIPAVAAVPAMAGFRHAAAVGAIVQRAAGSVPLLDLSGFVVRDRSHLFADSVETIGDGAVSDEGAALLSEMQSLNEFDSSDTYRHWLQSVGHEVASNDAAPRYDDYQYDPGFLITLDDFHDAVVPGLLNVDFKYDPSTISVNDQDRSLAAEWLELPLDFGEVPRAVKVYSSRLHAYNVTKRPITVHETLSAFHARNLSAPVLALPQHDEELVHEAWNDFLDIACLPNAREKLALYQSDPVALEESAVKDWVGKARPENVAKVFKYFVENPEAWEELRLGRYESMPKTDVKPPLSDKPLHTRVEPQVIVHHITAVNAIFSSIFRVLVRRFISLLKPNFMVNLLKDMPEVRDMMMAHHDWGASLVYLENDFSKYDKSQGLLVHMLEQHVFQQLGMNQRMLDAWGLGHVDCSIRSVTTGISLSVRYQRKSGDATTSFGNVLLNIVSVLHAYKGTDIVWGVFMGDDSLIAARTVCSGEKAVRTLAEKFNLQAKFFVTQAPYFASNFVLVNQEERNIVCVPDPLKRVEKWSMAITAADPKWDERYISAENTLRVYRNRFNTVGLAAAVYARYGSTDRINFDAIVDAVASAIRSSDDFRSMWEEKPTLITF